MPCGARAGPAGDSSRIASDRLCKTPCLEISRRRSTCRAKEAPRTFPCSHANPTFDLVDILAGSVGFFNNYNLCHIRTVNWDEILTGPKAKTIYVYNFTQPERECKSSTAIDCDSTDCSRLCAHLCTQTLRPAMRRVLRRRLLGRRSTQLSEVLQDQLLAAVSSRKMLRPES